MKKTIKQATDDFTAANPKLLSDPATMNNNTTTPIASSGVDGESYRECASCQGKGKNINEPCIICDGTGIRLNKSLDKWQSIYSAIAYGLAISEIKEEQQAEGIKRATNEIYANWQASQPTPPVDGSNIEDTPDQGTPSIEELAEEFFYKDSKARCWPKNMIIHVFKAGYSLRSSQQVSAVALLEKFVNACYTGCSKDELDLLRQEGEDILKLHNK